MSSGLAPFERQQKGSVPRPSSGLLAIFDVPWSVDSSPQSLLSCSHDVLPVCYCVQTPQSYQIKAPLMSTSANSLCSNKATFWGTGGWVLQHVNLSWKQFNLQQPVTTLCHNPMTIKRTEANYLVLRYWKKYWGIEKYFGNWEKYLNCKSTGMTNWIWN